MDKMTIVHITAASSSESKFLPGDCIPKMVRLSLSYPKEGYNLSTVGALPD